MKTAKTFREFLQIERKYWKRHIPWVDHDFKVHSPKGYNPHDHLNIWVNFVVDSPEKAYEVLRHKKTVERQRNLGPIMEEYLLCHDQRIIHDGREVTMRGVEITNEDYYWLLETPDGKKFCDTCVSRLIDETTI